MSWRRRLGSHIPPRAKHTIATTQAGWGRATARLRVLPDFLIIGAQRAGTTSLYKYLEAHPSVAPPLLGKGAHFFDTNFGKGEAWYRSHFPTRLHMHSARNAVTGEGSPYYLFHPHAPARVARLLPDVKLIALLRDPVSRAHSHYWHEVARGFEHLSFEQAIESEPQRLSGEVERMRADPAYTSFSHQHYSYLARGHYLEQLDRWYALFPSEQILVLSSEDFFSRPDESFRAVLRFLGLPEGSLRSYAKFNPREYRELSKDTEQRLVERFAEPNERLYEFLGVDFGWRR
ncbi:MAG: sulfotransferase domain-containing protein [Actinomycetota bacterium]|nr:sulfotransferase domain-containing protein [Actinomycetota bacterium]